jgi:hypothetical protein
MGSFSNAFLHSWHDLGRLGIEADGGFVATGATGIAMQSCAVSSAL